ncbi:uncharacterized protein V6R79_024845 [Siganus canaliculatus]
MRTVPARERGAVSAQSSSDSHSPQRKSPHVSQSTSARAKTLSVNGRRNIKFPYVASPVGRDEAAPARSGADKRDAVRSMNVTALVQHQVRPVHQTNQLLTKQIDQRDESSGSSGTDFIHHIDAPFWISTVHLDRSVHGKSDQDCQKSNALKMY